MTERAPISKKLRFDVFKRDSFTCQYCGAVGGQVLLHCDHVVPAAAGGETTLLNLITACVDCNLGKGARQLSDDSAVTKQHRQLADLEERRQQLEMMREWREELAQHQVSEIDIVAEAFLARSKFKPNDHGKISVRRWLRKHGLHEVLAAIDETFDLYFTADTSNEWEAAFKRVPKVLAMREQEKTDPGIRKLLYIQGILRNRWDDPHGAYVDFLRSLAAAGLPVSAIEAAAKGVGREHGQAELETYARRIAGSEAPAKAVVPVETAAQKDIRIERDALLARRDWPEWASFVPTSSIEVKALLMALAHHADAAAEYYANYLDLARFSGLPVAEVSRLIKGLESVGLTMPNEMVGSTYCEEGDDCTAFGGLHIDWEFCRGGYFKPPYKLSDYVAPLRFSRVGNVH